MNFSKKNHEHRLTIERAVSKTKITLLALLITAFSFAQNGINYKAVIKDGLGNVVANQPVTIQFSILKGAAQANVYSESHPTTTDNNGIVIVNIGEGTLIGSSPAFNTIDWGSDDHFLNVKVEIVDGVLTDMGTTEFKTVPYAYYASNVVWKKGNSEDIFNNNSGNVGIGNNNPSQKLEVSGKLKLGNDNTVPSAGTIRFNISTNDFEGHDGLGYKSFTNKELVHVEADQFGLTSNTRNSNIPVGAETTIVESGQYLIFYKCTINGLKSGYEDSSSDYRITLSVEQQNSVITNFIDDVSQNAYSDTSQIGNRLRWRQHEHLSDFIIFNLTTDTILKLYVKVDDNGIGTITNNYSVGESEIVAIKMRD